MKITTALFALIWIGVLAWELLDHFLFRRQSMVNSRGYQLYRSRVLQGLRIDLETAQSLIPIIASCYGRVTSLTCLALCKQHLERTKAQVSEGVQAH